MFRQCGPFWYIFGYWGGLFVPPPDPSPLAYGPDDDQPLPILLVSVGPAGPLIPGFATGAIVQYSARTHMHSRRLTSARDCSVC